MVSAALILCASALLVQTISAQCISCGNSCGLGCGYVGGGYGGGAAGVANSGGALSVVSSSPIAPSGLSVLSNDEYDGTLSVCGQLPFLSAVGLEGTLPTGGSGSVNYGCGSGNVGITGVNGGGYGGLGAGYGGLGGCGCGCGY